MSLEREGYRLTEYAQLAFEEWLDEYSGCDCSCHLSSPCSQCIHPGNPANLENDDESWEVVFSLVDSGRAE